MSTSHDFTVEARTFTAAITAVCEGRVRIVCDGRACTDGTTIHLPRPGDATDRAHLDALLGIGCHEAAHVYYDTPRLFKKFVEAHSPGRQPLAAECFNAVLDVADETRFERRFVRAKEHFIASTTRAALDYLAAGNVAVDCQSTTEALVRGIFSVRAARISDPAMRRVVRDLCRRDGLTQSVCEILKLAKTSGGGGRPNRRRAEWTRLGDLAKSLMRLFDISGLTLPSYSRPSTFDDAVSALGKLFRAIVRAAAGRTSILLGSAPSIPSLSDFFNGKIGDSTPAYNKAAPYFRRYARQLLEAPAPTLSRASHSGRRLGDVTRLNIDGRVFLRPSERSDVRSAVAVCLDCSHSMQSILADAAGNAWALADALKSARGNVACFHFGDNPVRMPLNRMGQARLLGITRTDLLVAAASQWLASQVEPRRVIAIFTDGCACDMEAAAAASKRAKRQGVQILAGVFPGTPVEWIADSLPGAEVFEVGDDLVSGFHQAIRRIVRPTS